LRLLKTITINHEIYIKRCLQLAKNGIGATRPNPSVGALIVLQNKIIGEGFTGNYGGSHAEVNAINAVIDKSVLRNATLYVTLEPCSHFGKTPPCADLIVSHGIKKVVIGCIDANVLVAGKGIDRLKKAGCKVVVGVLESECKEHHKRFFTFQHKKRPFIILKWAVTADGFIAPKSKNKQKPVFISNQYSQQLVHKWRSQEHAILVGTTTAIVDNPELNVRSWFGNSPIRIVLDRNFKIPADANLFDTAVKTIVITDLANKKTHARISTSAKVSVVVNNPLIFEQIDFSRNFVKQLCDVFYKHQIQSVIIEGGTKTLQTFIDENYWDEARIFFSDVNFHSGVKAPVFLGALQEEKKTMNDLLKIYRND